MLTLPSSETRVFDELVASWNAECPLGSQVKVEARCFANGRGTAYYTMGLWSSEGKIFSRESVKGQSDVDGRVATDTLQLAHLVNGFQLRITVISTDTGETPKLKFVSVALHHRGIPTPVTAAGDLPDKVLPVPQRSQLGYEGSTGWCSPTSTSMILAYWSAKLKRPELDVPVPQVAEGVYDRNWPGTGNWPFNTAFAGSFPGMRAYVTRLNTLDEVGQWIGAGVPVALSVDLPLLNGDKSSPPSGHIVVVVGFTRDGRVVVNDPWPNPQGENRLQKIFPRSQVEEGWANSLRTVYLIYPEGYEKPVTRWHHWEE
ncbi:MAG: Peptidase like family [Verrucomicrobiales bacterium]|nr:Peptidase like family [Verrucomicrobiales bacterium]